MGCGAAEDGASLHHGGFGVARQRSEYPGASGGVALVEENSPMSGAADTEYFGNGVTMLGGGIIEGLGLGAMVSAGGGGITGLEAATCACAARIGVKAANTRQPASKFRIDMISSGLWPC